MRGTRRQLTTRPMQRKRLFMLPTTIQVMRDMNQRQPCQRLTASTNR